MPKATLWCGFWRPAGALDTFQPPWIPLEVCGVVTNLLNEQVGLVIKLILKEICF